MKSNIEHLIKYRDQLKTLEELKKKNLGGGGYDEVEFTISPNATITETWSNSENDDSKIYKFKISRIQTYIENIRKKVEYWTEKDSKRTGENKK